MIKNVDGVFRNFPNLIHVSGHEHGLQLIDNKRNRTIPDRERRRRQRKLYDQREALLFGTATQGYVVADLLHNNDVRFTFIPINEGKIAAAYQYTRLYTSFKPQEEAAFKAIMGDSTLAAGPCRVWRGQQIIPIPVWKNYREEWEAKTTLPVLVGIGNKRRTKTDKTRWRFSVYSLRLKDANGKEFALRTVEKKPDQVVPFPFRAPLSGNFSTMPPVPSILIRPLS